MNGAEAVKHNDKRNLDSALDEEIEYFSEYVRHHDHLTKAHEGDPRTFLRAPLFLSDCPT